MTVVNALTQSFLGKVEPSVRDDALRGARITAFAPGETVVSEVGFQRAGVMIAGIVRIFLRTAPGRQVTLRYVRSGNSVGMAALLSEVSIAAEALTESRVLLLNSEAVLSTAARSAGLALAVAADISRVVAAEYAEFAFREEATIRQRLARHLLDCSVIRPGERMPTVLLSHEQIADALGSAREVISRHLSDFRSEGMLSLGRIHITLTDPARLHSAVFSRH